MKVDVASNEMIDLELRFDGMPEQTHESSDYGRDASASGGRQSASGDHLLEVDEAFPFRMNSAVPVEDRSDTFNSPTKEELPPPVEYGESRGLDLSEDFMEYSGNNGADEVSNDSGVLPDDSTVPQDPRDDAMSPRIQNQRMMNTTSRTDA
jgi:hypothetical protein